MRNKVFRVWKKFEYNKAGQTDLIEIKPNKGGNHLFIQKWILETIVWAICAGELIHLSGPSGSAKTALIEALMIEENFIPIVKALSSSGSKKFPLKPLTAFPIEMPVYETPGEFQFRRGLSGGTTFDEESDLVKALKEAQVLKKTHYVMIWLREMGRVHSSNVQGGLLNLMSKAEIILRNNERLDGNDICWIADSNYQADQDSHFTLVPLDTALKRRFSVNVTLNYLSREEEITVLESIIKRDTDMSIDLDLIDEVVKLGTIIRDQQADGNLQSVPPPTIYGYLTYYKMVISLKHLNRPLIAQTTLLGHANSQDEKFIPEVLKQVYALNYREEDEMEPLSQNLF